MDTTSLQPNALDHTAPGSDGRDGAVAPSAHATGSGTAIALAEVTGATDVGVPRLVTRGESSYHEVTGDDGESYIAVFSGRRPKLIHIPKPKIDGVATAAIVDYLNCTFPFSVKQSLADFFSELLGILGAAFAPAINRNRGLYGYEHSFQLGESKALFAYGGNNGTGFLTLSGESCHQIPDWKRLVNYLANIRQAHITRWDGAHDDFDGTHSVDEAFRMYQEGLFKCGGTKPKKEKRGDWDDPDGSGRTLYVGLGESGKLLRVYEKGMQLGIPWHPWVRWECELKI